MTAVSRFQIRFANIHGSDGKVNGIVAQLVSEPDHFSYGTLQFTPVKWTAFKRLMMNAGIELIDISPGRKR